MNEAALSMTTQENRDEIERRISELQTRTGRTYTACRDEVRRLQPALFGLEPVIANRGPRSLTLEEARNDATQARQIADAIEAYRIKNRAATYGQAREAIRRERPDLFDPES